jgi:hypothetical protein
MRLVFTKGSGKYDRLEVGRDGAAPERVDCPKQGIIPHDMVHYAVESVMAARGFLSRLADGAPATFAPGGESEEAIERLVETIQAEAWSGPAPADELIGLYELTCEARGHGVMPVDADAIEAIRARVAELTAAWNAVPVGGTLELAFEGR